MKCQISFYVRSEEQGKVQNVHRSETIQKRVQAYRQIDKQTEVCVMAD